MQSQGTVEGRFGLRCALRSQFELRNAHGAPPSATQCGSAAGDSHFQNQIADMTHGGDACQGAAKSTICRSWRSSPDAHAAPLPCPYTGIVDAFRQRVEQELPGMYTWFADSSLHVTIRALLG